MYSPRPASSGSGSSHPTNTTSGSDYLQEALRLKRAQTTHPTADSNIDSRSNSSNERQSGSSILRSDREAMSSPAGPKRRNRESRRNSVAEVKTVTVPRDIGARETDRLVDQLSKENFNLKHALHENRKLVDKLRSEVEAVQPVFEERDKLKDELGKTRGDLFKVKEEKEAAWKTNDELIAIMETKDKELAVLCQKAAAFEQALELICRLEAQVVELSSQVSPSRPLTAVPNVFSPGTSVAETQTQASSVSESMVHPAFRKPTPNRSLPPRTDSSPSTKSLSMVGQKQPLKPVASQATIATEFEETETNAETVPIHVPPEISESELNSIYGVTRKQEPSMFEFSRNAFRPDPRFHRTASNPRAAGPSRPSSASSCEFESDTDVFLPPRPASAHPTNFRQPTRASTPPPPLSPPVVLPPASAGPQDRFDRVHQWMAQQKTTTSPVQQRVRPVGPNRSLTQPPTRQQHQLLRPSPKKDISQYIAESRALTERASVSNPSMGGPIFAQPAQEPRAGVPHILANAVPDAYGSRSGPVKQSLPPYAAQTAPNPPLSQPPQTPLPYPPTLPNPSRSLHQPYDGRQSIRSASAEVPNKSQELRSSGFAPGLNDQRTSYPQPMERAERLERLPTSPPPAEIEVEGPRKGRRSSIVNAVPKLFGGLRKGNRLSQGQGSG